VTVQAALFSLMTPFAFGPIGNRAVDWIAMAELLLFIMAVPSAVLRPGLVSRIWLIASSLFFLAYAGFIYAVTGIRF
jgi:hypothetical protein